MKPTSSAVEHDLRLEHRFTRQLKAILGNQFIVQDSGEDLKGASDFLVWGICPFKVAVRLRTYKYLLLYPNQFTIRWSRPSGIETEIHKIKKGLVDYLLYGFVDEAEKYILSYFIADFSIFRKVNPKPVAIFSNTPPDSQLAVFDLDQFSGDFILKRWYRATDSGPLGGM